MMEECRIHFPLILRGMLRDEFGNIASTDETPPVVKLDGCSLSPTEGAVYLERGGSFNVSCVPRRRCVLVFARAER
jgi:hypothetical protein